MNSFLFSAITLCLAAQCALANYHQSAPSYGGGYQQRKMAPTPQTYAAPAAYRSNDYQPQQSYEPQMTAYEQPQQTYRAPSSAAVSSYDERTPAASSYNRAASSYGRQQSGYGAATAPAAYAPASYAKPAPKYEEPYHAPMPFAWGYDINDGYGGAQYHKETGDDYGKRTGSYGYTDAYGVYRQVDYVADENGFRATIKTNEPGTANESPADVELHAYEPPSNYYAGNKEASYGSSYGASAAPAQAYSAAPAKQASYGQSSYGAQASSYSAPRPASYAAPQRSSYSAKQQAPRYEPASQYASSSQVVPVYQKAAPVAAKLVEAKRY